MLQHKFTKLLTILAVSTGLSVITPVITNFAQPTIVNADTSDLPSDGPWESSNNGYPYKLSLHNGNTVYYSIAPNDTHHKYFQQAVADWESLGVLKFQQVNWGDSSSQITMQTVNQNGQGENTNGDTSMSGLHDVNGTAVPTQTNIVLYPAVDDDMSDAQKQVTADHEFGHALGFAHDNRKFKFNGKKYRNYHMIMNQYTNYAHYYSLGGIEQRMLEEHYGITASVDLSAMTY